MNNLVQFCYQFDNFSSSLGANDKVVYRKALLVIEKSDDIYNSLSLYNRLEKNTFYKLSIGAITLKEGKTNEVTFVIKDCKQNQAVCMKAFPLNQPCIYIFRTDQNVTNLELKIYAGPIKKANDISIEIHDIVLSKCNKSENQDELLFYNKFNILYLGFITANRYCSYDKEHFYIIINRHIGDSMNYLSLLHAFREYYGADKNCWHFNAAKQMSRFKKSRRIKKLTVITTKSIQGVAALYEKDLDEIITLSKQELDALERYAVSSVSLHSNLIPDENAVSLENGYHETTWTKKRMLGVDDHLWDLGLPLNSQRADMMITKNTEIAALETMDSLKLQPEKTVIICPVALSSSMLPTEIWEEFALKQKEKGYRVFTNVAGNETAISGTEPLKVGVNVLCCMADKGCRIIGVQCGLLDVLCKYSLNLHISVIHPMITNGDKRYAEIRKVFQPVVHTGRQTDIKIEKFEREYVVNFLNEQFI